MIMLAKHQLLITAITFCLWFLRRIDCQQCTRLGPNSVNPNVQIGQKVVNLTFATIRANIVQQCINLCYYRKLCHSFNFHSVRKQCELNIEPIDGHVYPLEPDEQYRYGLLEEMPGELAGKCLSHDCPEMAVCIPYSDSYTCLPVDYDVKCEVPPTKDWATLITNETRYFPAEFTYTCLYGYVSGNPTIRCFSNGQWNSSNVVCQVPIDCGIPTSAIVGIDVIYDITYQDSVATHVCQSDWIYTSGSNTSVCQSNGTWTVPTLVCTSTIDCGDPDELADYTGTEMVYDTTTAFSVVNYVCKVDWVYISGSNQSVCQLNQTWSQPTILCAPTTCYVVHPSYGTIYKGSAATMSIVIIFTITLDCDPWNITLWPSNYSIVDQGPISNSGNHCRGFPSYATPVCFGKNGIVHVIGPCPVSEC
ncbi:sushi, von Willebrand factor type A, EGF and pentraxin domain-containing protein 1 [Patella vulgata]|uniref:sushi, von Willebrand factor type A, EGF and pentraxin domain-containing protein 1 n=1 Tax=Patella vulgata TaxID=6465 RepID=UPI00217F5F5E|nr:sushi, von Willebrand factor type A, EGF and pentraxin domain-containing protein 1 [Patella vulgata]